MSWLCVSLYFLINVANPILQCTQAVSRIEIWNLWDALAGLYAFVWHLPSSLTNPIFLVHLVLSHSLQFYHSPPSADCARQRRCIYCCREQLTFPARLGPSWLLRRLVGYIALRGFFSRLVNLFLLRRLCPQRLWQAVRNGTGFCTIDADVHVSSDVHVSVTVSFSSFSWGAPAESWPDSQCLMISCHFDLHWCMYVMIRSFRLENLSRPSARSAARGSRSWWFWSDLFFSGYTRKNRCSSKILQMMFTRIDFKFLNYQVNNNETPLPSHLKKR